MPMACLRVIAFDSGTGMQDRGLDILRFAWMKIRKCEVVMGGGSGMRLQRCVEQC